MSGPAAPDERAAVPVLFVAFQSGAKANGGLQSLTEILRRLRRVRPILLTQVESSYTEHWRALGYEVHIWPVPWPRSPAAKRLPRTQRMAGDVMPLLMGNLRMLPLLRSRGVRVVHCNDAWASLIAAPSARLAGARVVLNIRDTLFVDERRWSLMCALADRVIVLSEEMRQVVQQRLSLPAWLHAGRKTPVTAVYSAVDATLMRPASDGARSALRRSFGIAEGEIAVGVIGALMAKKRQLELLQFLTSHPERLPANVKLYFVGDCSPEVDGYARDCKRLAEHGPLQARVHFVGYSREIAHWYQALDLTLMVSRFEGLARGMIESVACGTPVVAFDFCSAREILEQHACGLVAPQEDFRQLLEHLHRLAQDGELRRRLGQNGPPLAAELFAPESVAARYESIYLELEGEKRKFDAA
jgi:glycosyltransferase involved in cell wall biosynthesis